MGRERTDNNCDRILKTTVKEHFGCEAFFQAIKRKRERERTRTSSVLLFFTHSEKVLLTETKILSYLLFLFSKSVFYFQPVFC